MVAAAVFKDYIAWSYDNSGNDQMGWLSRLPRDDFYAGNWGDTVQKIGRVAPRAVCWTHRIAPDVWLISTGESAAGYQYGMPQEVYILYENASKIAGGVRYMPSDIDVGQSVGNAVRFPAMPYDTTAKGVSMMNVRQLGAGGNMTGRGDHLGRGHRMETHLDLQSGDTILPQGGEIRQLQSDGSEEPVLEFESTNNRQRLRNVGAEGLPELRLEDNYARLRDNGSPALSASNNASLMNVHGNRLFDVEYFLQTAVKSTPPSNPSAGDMYIDDSMNTASGHLAIRIYDGAAWVNQN